MSAPGTESHALAYQYCTCKREEEGEAEGEDSWGM